MVVLKLIIRLINARDMAQRTVIGQDQIRYIVLAFIFCLAGTSSFNNGEVNIVIISDQVSLNGSTFSHASLELHRRVINASLQFNCVVGSQSKHFIFIINVH